MCETSLSVRTRRGEGSLDVESLGGGAIGEGAIVGSSVEGSGIPCDTRARIRRFWLVSSASTRRFNFSQSNMT